MSTTEPLKNSLASTKFTASIRIANGTLVFTNQTNTIVTSSFYSIFSTALVITPICIIATRVVTIDILNLTAAMAACHKVISKEKRQCEIQYAQT